MAKHADSSLFSSLLAVLLFSVVILLAVVFVFSIQKYDAVARLEAYAAKRVPFLAAETPSALSADEGAAYIRAQEAMDPEEINETLRAIRQTELEAIRAQREAELEAMREQQAEQIEAMQAQRLSDMMDGTENVWSMFEDYVFIGDSRVLGFSYYGFLPENRVLAELGATILGVSDKLWQIRQLDPSYIYLSFGANDLVSYIWPTGPEYAARYKQAVELLQSEFPYATVVVNSIPAIRESSLHTQEIYYRVPEFNEALRQMCEETGAVFVDNDAVAAAHTELYAGDGIHFDPGFYRYWAATMMEAVLEAGETALFEPDETSLPDLDEELLLEMEEYGLIDNQTAENEE